MLRRVLPYLFGIAILMSSPIVQGQIVLHAKPDASEVKTIRMMFECFPRQQQISNAKIELRLKPHLSKGVSAENWEFIEFNLNGFSWVMKPDDFANFSKADIPQQRILPIATTAWLKNGKNILEIRSLGLKANADPESGHMSIEFESGDTTVEVLKDQKWQKSKIYMKLVLADSIEPTSQVSNVCKAYYAWPGELVFPDRNVLHKITLNSMRKPVIVVARGEVEPIQLVVESGDRALQNIRLVCNDLKSDSDVLSAKQVDIRIVGYVMVENERWPDPLLPQPGKGANILPKSRQAWWITVTMPLNQKPGLYRGNVNIISGDKTLIQVPLTVSVIDFQFPSPLPMGLSIGCSIKPEVMPLALARHFYPHNCAIGIKKMQFQIDETENIHVNFTEFDKEVRTLRSQWGMKYICLGFILGDASGGVYSRSTLTPNMIDAKGHSVKVCIDPKVGAKENKYFDSIFRQYVKHLKEMGWLEDSFIYLWDEPNTNELARQTGEYATYFRQAAPELKLLTVSGPSEMLKDLDIFCTLINHVQDKTVTWCEKNKKHFWIYSCGNLQHPSLIVGKPALDSRVFGWIAYRFHAENMLHWAVDVNMAKMKFIPDDITYTNMVGRGDGCLFYPALEKHISPIPSIRSENLRDGLEDAIVLGLLSRENSNEKFVRGKILKLIPDQFHYNTDPVTYMEFRQAAYTLLEKTKKGQER
jgi:hypothetical protein